MSGLRQVGFCYKYEMTHTGLPDSRTHIRKDRKAIKQERLLRWKRNHAIKDYMFVEGLRKERTLKHGRT
jgi:hypothetical protein